MESTPLLQDIEIVSLPRVERQLSSRHIQMIAIGLLTKGLFIASGATISSAGPLGALIGYGIVGIMVYVVMTSLGELATYLPVSGSFTTYASRYVHPALGFSLGWNYWLQWAVSFPSEVNAASMILSFWIPNIPTWISAVVILAFLFTVNCFGAKGFGESEYWLAIVKVLAIILFIIVGIILDLGYVGSEGYLGFKYWDIEGAPIKNGIVGIFNVFLMAFFSFGGTELVGITAGEAKEPEKTIPKAIKNTFWRIRNDDPNLLNASISNDITVAPFTLVFQKAGMSFAAHLMNGVVFTAVLSAGNSALYAASRTLMAMAQEGKAPSIFGKVTKSGVPVYSLIATVGIGCLSFLGIVLGDGLVFTYLISITGVSGILTWISIALIHIRFRGAFKAQSIDLSVLVYQSSFYPAGPIIAILLGIAIICAQGYAAIQSENPAMQFIITFSGVPFFIGLFLYHKLKFNSELVPLDKIIL
ncbi:hypothetical protein HK103_006813 [Boothiomyces macroporosus]|uniref:Amino acid permease/ SLC12A domain-containing protein n=1 Tax=Boothiomyces macroporosus TaxID=261099 RepID=A0AAD5UDV3_9FUNG|nr:hypothetical protein HK103_006813 [Boothiomyces macroporosus]